MSIESDRTKVTLIIKSLEERIKAIKDFTIEGFKERPEDPPLHIPTPEASPEEEIPNETEHHNKKNRKKKNNE